MPLPTNSANRSHSFIDELLKLTQNYQDQLKHPENIEQLTTNQQNVANKLLNYDLSEAFTDEQIDLTQFNTSKPGLPRQLLFVSLWAVTPIDSKAPHLYSFDVIDCVVHKYDLQEIIPEIQSAIDAHEVLLHAVSCSYFDYNIYGKSIIDNGNRARLLKNFVINQLRLEVNNPDITIEDVKKVKFDMASYMDRLFTIFKSQTIRQEIESADLDDDALNLNVPLLEKKLTDAKLENALTYQSIIQAMKEPDYNFKLLK